VVATGLLTMEVSQMNDKLRDKFDSKTPLVIDTDNRRILDKNEVKKSSSSVVPLIIIGMALIVLLILDLG
tara:strand:+ start:161 stop:370 length:210 start_codon:yes stop_codon:yes gene_type:complete